jgi:hypothetical protein
MWLRLPEGQLRLVPLEDDPSSLTFCLWSLPGKKMLYHDGSRLLLVVEIHGTRVHIAIHLALGSGDRFGFCFSSALPLAQQASRVQAAVRVVNGSPTSGAVHAIRREALVHMGTLQTVDAGQARASQRDTASALFGWGAVTHHWHQDSELRARVRHYLRRGRAMMRGDYLRLLYPSSQSQWRDVLRSETCKLKRPPL